MSAETRVVTGGPTRRLCTFTLGDLLLGADITAVEEAVRERDITAVPLAGPTMAGVLNLRGRILSVIDLRTRLGIQRDIDMPRSTNGPHLVVRTSTGSVSLIVDRLVGVIDVAAESGTNESHAPAPPHLPDQLRDAISMVHRLSPQLLIEIDLERVCTPVAV